MSARESVAGDAADRLAAWWDPQPGTQNGAASAAPYRRLALQFMHEFAPAGEPLSVLLATPDRSPMPAQACIGLAYCLAEELGKRVMLADVCTQDPALSRAFGADAAAGYTELLDSPSLPLDTLALATSHPRVRLLPAGGHGPATRGRQPDEVAAALGALQRDADFVVLSGGSLLHDTAALALTPHVGLVLMMPVENQTLVTDLDAAQKALRFCKARRTGVVMLKAPPRG